MTEQYIGPHIRTVDNEIEARLTPFTPAAVDGANFEESHGYFGHPSMSVAPDLGKLVAAAAPHRVPYPKFIPAGLRPFGLHHLRTPGGSLSDMAVTFIEREMKDQPLWSGRRALRPSDYAVAVFWTRRIGTPVVYTAQRTTRLNEEAGLLQNPHRADTVGPYACLQMTWEALPGAEPLRARRCPAEFAIWYDEEAAAWISIYSQLPEVSALVIARDLYS